MTIWQQNFLSIIIKHLGRAHAAIIVVSSPPIDRGGTIFLSLGVSFPQIFCFFQFDWGDG